MTAILLDILGPILLMVGIGALVRRAFDMDLATLAKLNIYVFTPAFVFDRVAHSALPWADMGGVVLISVVQVATLGAVVWGIGRAAGGSHKTLAAIALATMFYNSGNYGIPLAELAYPGRDLAAATATAGAKNGGAVQAFVVLTQNVLLFTVGLAVAASAGGGGAREVLGKLLRLPVLYTLAAALVARAWLQADADNRLPALFDKTARYLSAGLVPVALVTLGAQLASNPRWPRWRPVMLVTLLRLVLGPVQMAAILYALHRTGVPALQLWPWPAELLILTAAVPTAVNTLLLTLELDGDTDLAADCVFWTTVFSCVTIFGWLVVIRWWFA